MDAKKGKKQKKKLKEQIYFGVWPLLINFAFIYESKHNKH